MLQTVTVETFTPYVGDTFNVELDATTVFPLELASVVTLSERTAPYTSNPRSPFSLLFRGSHTPVLPQQIYHIVHQTLGALDIFLVPIGPDRQGMQYEAIFT